ncbi:hypothetical protein ACSBR2_003388 [Camellia fascicularis]
MEECFMLMCKYSKSYAPIKISEGCSYHEVVKKICAKFKKLSVGNCCLFFSIPGYSNCIVECDDDLGNMMSMVASSGSHVVGVIGELWMLMIILLGLILFYPEPKRVLLSASWKGIIHSVGQEFDGGVPMFHIVWLMNYLKNDVTRVTIECMMKLSTSCKWFVHGMMLMNSSIFFTMKLDNVHTCGVVARRSCSKMVGSRLVSDIVYNDISDNPLTHPIEIKKKKLKKQYDIDVSYQVALLGVDKARGGLFGDFVSSFDQL